MLARQGFGRRDEDDPIPRLLFQQGEAGVQHMGLACSCRHPECRQLQVCLGEIWHIFTLGLMRRQPCIQAYQQRTRVIL